MIAEVRTEVLNRCPPEASLTGIEIEGPQIVLLSRNPTFSITGQPYASELAKILKKRVTIRTAPQQRKEENEAEEEIMSILPKEAGVKRLIFNHNTGEVIAIATHLHILEASIEVLSMEVAKRTGWKLIAEMKFLSDSKTFLQVLHVLTSPSESRTRFLRETGDRIFRIPLSEAPSLMVSFLGGVEQVGRSSVLVSSDESKVLLDSGVNPGASNRSFFFPRFDYELSDFDSLDAIVISHAHLDHIGALPFAIKYGYEGPIYMTEPTLHLVTLLLEDLHTVETRSGSMPFFDLKDIRSVIERTIILKYGQVTDISPDLRITLHNAGHILGSAMIQLTLEDSAHNLLYTSDFKLGRSLLLNQAISHFARIDSLLMESTYGGEGDIMPNRAEVEGRLISLANEAFSKGGKALIPTLAVGRAQEVALILTKAMENKQIEVAPIFLDGMIMEVTKVHSAFPEYLSSELFSLITEEDIDPLKSEYVVPVKNQSGRTEAMSEGKAIILSTSGMLEGGPVLEYFRFLAPDGRNAIIFVNYQIEGTLGQRILSGVRDVQLYDQDGRLAKVNIQSPVHRMDGLSGHSDRAQLLTFARSVLTGRGPLFLMHGERTKLRTLQRTMNRMFLGRVHVPRISERSRIV